MKSFQAVVYTYAAILGLATLWAWCVDIWFLHSPIEHLGPDVLLRVLTLPSSASLSNVYDASPTFFSKPLTQLGWLTFCGLAQVVLLLLIVALARRAWRSKA